jgi:DNA-binding response OmpR family regulator
MANLMIVDDDEEFAAALAVPLRQQGHKVEIRTDTATAMTEMQSRPPDLVILDVMFSGNDFAGFELARAMRACRDLDRIPILMLTGLNQKLDLSFDTLDIDNSFLPVSDFVSKPVDLGELVSKVTFLLQSAGPWPHDTTRRESAAP